MGIAAPLTRKLTRQIARSITDPSGGAASFSPASLFSGGEQGGWYDYSDMSTLFQLVINGDAITAVEQPIGIVLDKSKGRVLSSDFVTNGDFSVGTGWTLSSATITGGKLVCNTGAAFITFCQQAMAASTPSGAYEVSLTISNYVSGSVIAGVTVGASGENTFSGNGTFTKVYALAATAFDARILGGGAGFIGDIDNFSIRQISGNHLIQATSAARPVWSARKNLLTRTEDFADAAWTKTATTVTSNAAVAPDGSVTADSLTPTATGFSVAQTTLITNTDYTVTVYVKDNGAGSCAVACGGLGIGYLINLNTITGAFISGRSYGGGTLLGYDITSAGNGWWKVELSAGAVLQGCLILSADSTSPTSGIYVWGAQNEFGPTPTRYQRVTTSTDYDTAGFPHFARYDGVDDTIGSANFVMPGVDNALMWAGTKFSDAVVTPIINKQYFLYSGPGSGSITLNGAYSPAATEYSYIAGGGGVVLQATPYPAPHTGVVITSASTSDPIAQLEVNGSLTQSTATQGDNTFASSPFYIASGQGFAPFGQVDCHQALILSRKLTPAEKANLLAFGTGKISP